MISKRAQNQIFKIAEYIGEETLQGAQSWLRSIFTNQSQHIKDIM